jgi:hypothetical protein
MSTKNERMNERIRQHGVNLLAICPHAPQRDPVKLAKQVHRLEAKAHRMAEDHCNGTAPKDFNLGAFGDDIFRSLFKILGPGEYMFHVRFNWDPRGYALKLSDEYVRHAGLTIHRDMGGYGILAPYLTND